MKKGAKTVQYVINDVNTEQGWVQLTVTWDDDTTYEKRMMVPMDSEESISGAIESWLKDYLPMHEAEKNAFNPTDLNGQIVTVDIKSLLAE